MSSASGSGKSTMAALLQTPSLSIGGPVIFFWSDDFVLVDAKTKKAHVSPAAIAIKEGFYPVISGLNDPALDADACYGGPRSGGTRYISPRFHEKEPYKPRRVRKIVFLQYDKKTGFKMEGVPPLKALAIFHEEAWVSHQPSHARAFIDWFVKLAFDRLEYSESRKAAMAIRELFDR